MTELLEPYAAIQKYTELLHELYEKRTQLYKTSAFSELPNLLSPLNRKEDAVVRLMRRQKRHVDNALEKLPPALHDLVISYFTDVLDKQKNFLDAEKRFIDGQEGIGYYLTAVEKYRTTAQQHLKAFEHALTASTEKQDEAKKAASKLRPYLVSAPIFVELFVIILTVWYSMMDGDLSLENLLNHHVDAGTWVLFVAVANLIIGLKLVERTENAIIGAFDMLRAAAKRAPEAFN